MSLEAYLNGELAAPDPYKGPDISMQSPAIPSGEFAGLEDVSMQSSAVSSGDSANMLMEQLISGDEGEEGGDSEEEVDEDESASDSDESDDGSGIDNENEEVDEENSDESDDSVVDDDIVGVSEGVDDSDIAFDNDNDDEVMKTGQVKNDIVDGAESKQEAEQGCSSENGSSLPLDSLISENLSAKKDQEQGTSEAAAAENGETDGKKSKEKTPKKRKRKKATEKGDKKEKKAKKRKKSKPSNLRRNIRDIMGDDHFEAETLAAQEAELERKKRLQELQKQLQEQAQKKKEEQDSQLKTLLQIDEMEKEEECIMLDSSDESKKKDVIDISSDEDDVVITKDEDDEVETEDPDNAGGHINDALNIPDEEGRIVVNIGHPDDEDDVFLPPFVANNIKPHQIGGVRFLYDNLVESKARFKTSPGLGCILAHSMGLGKTIQMIAFVDIFLRNCGSKTVLVIVPINTLQNWMSEFELWVPENVKPEVHGAVTPRPYKVFLLNDMYKTTPARSRVIEEWYKVGGVLLMGYEMYRLLSSRRGHISKAKKPGRKPASPVVIDIEEEDHNKNLLVDVHKALINPGPDLVICDEGHRIKNSHAGISQSLKNIRTRRRVVLTGYPLQNNLIEYWCMVDFVRPNYLGNKTEFTNMFERPILNGQCADSTPADTQLMRYRAHVLHSLLEGFVQRRGHTVLQRALPPKQEFVFLIRMSPIQRQLYKRCMETVNESGLRQWANNNPLKAFSICCKIWNHPDVLYKILQQKNAEDNDLDIETTEGGQVKKKGRRTKKVADNPASPFGDRRNEVSINYDWAKDIFKDYVPGLFENGGKMVILFNIIEESLAMGDKILVFSQSLFTLDMIEEYLSRYNVPREEFNEKWCRNKNYFRLDGSTGPQDRERMINAFNSADGDQYWLFLLSTRAGSLGVNLIGANRVVVVDASWNPCHDCQAICRVYRFGQVKPSFIYRLVTDNTMEKKIYDRQIAKQGMSDRVVDELQPQNQFMRGQTDNLLRYEDKEFDTVDFSNCEEEYDDYVMCNVLKNQGQFLTKAPFTHESLLIDKKELRLTKKEKRLAKQGYVMEKRMNTTYSRPSYAAFYPKGQEGGVSIIRQNAPTTWTGNRYLNRPIASVKPMMTTPVPMQPKTIKFPIASKAKPGVSVHKVLTSTDIVLPGSNTTSQAGAGVNKIPAGQNIFVIKTPKGVYIRTAEGKIFAVRSKLPVISRPSITGMPSTSTATVTMATASGIAKPIIKSMSAPMISIVNKNSIGNVNNNSDAKTSEIKTSFSDKDMETGNDLLSKMLDDSPPSAEKGIHRTDSSSSLASQLGHLDFLNNLESQDSDSNSNSSLEGVKTSKKGNTSIIDLSQTKVPKIAPNLSKVMPQVKGQMPRFFLPPVPMLGKNMMPRHQQPRMPFVFQNRMMFPPSAPNPVPVSKVISAPRVSSSNADAVSTSSDTLSTNAAVISTSTSALTTSSSVSNSTQGSVPISAPSAVPSLTSSSMSMSTQNSVPDSLPSSISSSEGVPPFSTSPVSSGSDTNVDQGLITDLLSDIVGDSSEQEQHSLQQEIASNQQQASTHQPHQPSNQQQQHLNQQNLVHQQSQPVQQQENLQQPMQQEPNLWQDDQQNQEQEQLNYDQQQLQPNEQQENRQHYQKQMYQPQQQDYQPSDYPQFQQQMYPQQAPPPYYQQNQYQPQQNQYQHQNQFSPYPFQQYDQYQQQNPMQSVGYGSNHGMSNMPNMGMSSMQQMPGMPMQHGYMGFPFAPYPFPVPQPVMMASGLTGQPYMPMGMPQMGQGAYGMGGMGNIQQGMMSPPPGGQGQMMPQSDQGQGHINAADTSMMDNQSSNQ